MHKFKVGDQFRRFKMGGDYTKIQTVTKITPNKIWDDQGSWHYPTNIVHAYPDTPAGRLQEQLDLIAEKETVLAETQKAIDAAREKINQIDNRPPAPGDTWKSVFGTAKIVHVDKEGIFYIFSASNSSLVEPTGASSDRFLREFGYKLAN